MSKHTLPKQTKHNVGVVLTHKYNTRFAHKCADTYFSQKMRKIKKEAKKASKQVRCLERRKAQLKKMREYQFPECRTIICPWPVEDGGFDLFGWWFNLFGVLSLSSPLVSPDIPAFLNPKQQVVLDSEPESETDSEPESEPESDTGLFPHMQTGNTVPVVDMSDMEPFCFNT